ncbi:MAG: hypothetical protein QXG86_01750 [Candidatus Woesearchaeota archaeon]
MLYDVLSNRACVNILKIIYDNESQNKNVYSIKKSEILKKIKNKKDIEDAIITLSYEMLILKEEVEGELHISITEKGKRFIEIFDQLVSLMKDEPITRPSVEIKYDLTEIEKKILGTLYRMQVESAKEISLSDLSRELYPYDDYEKKKSKVSSALTRLQSLNLIRKIKNNRTVYASVTDSGEKVAKKIISVNIF